MVDAAATQAALVRTGHDSFLRRVRRLVDPNPPTLLVDPVLVPRPGAERARGAPLRGAAEAPPSAGRVARRGVLGHPVAAGRRDRPRAIARIAADGRAHRRADALAGADARRARADDECCRSGGRRSRGPRRRADRALLPGRGGRFARAAAPGEAPPFPPGRPPLPRHVRSGPDRESRRALPRELASARGQRALRRRGEERADPSVEAGPGTRRALDLRLDLCRRVVIDPPSLTAPEADSRRPDDRRGKPRSGSASRSPRSRPTWAPRRRTASTTCS